MGNSEVASIERVTKAMGNPPEREVDSPTSYKSGVLSSGKPQAKCNVQKVKNLIGIKLWSANEDPSIGADF